MLEPRSSEKVQDAARKHAARQNRSSGYLGHARRRFRDSQLTEFPGKLHCCGTPGPTYCNTSSNTSKSRLWGTHHTKYLLNGMVHSSAIVSFFVGKIQLQSRRCSRKKKKKKSEFLSRMCGSKDPYFGRYFENFFDFFFDFFFLRVLEF